MRTEKNSLLTQSSDNLFKDQYGVLQLAANATLRRTPKSPKMMQYLCLKFIQWPNSILILVKDLWERNNITFSDFIWMEPSDFTYEIIWQERIQKEKDE